MTHFDPNDERPPLPEQLSAYVDGELDAQTRSRVEAWLSSDPHAAAEVAGLRRLAEIWRQTQPPEPGEAVWAELYDRLEGALPAETYRSRRALWVGWGMAAATSAAAAVLLVVALQSRSRPVLQPADLPTAERPLLTDEDDLHHEPLLVAEADELEIIRLDAVAHEFLVVGEPPLSDPLVLASPGDIRLQSFKPAQEDLRSTVRVDDDSAPPLIVVHLK